MTARRLLGSAAGLAALTLLGKSLGLVRELVIAGAFGAGSAYDAYLVAAAVPEVLAFIALHVALYLFVPLYLEERERSAHSADRFAAAFLTRASLLLVGLGVVLIVASPAVVRLVAPGLDESARRIATVSLRWISVFLLGRGLEGALRGLAHADRRFWVPTLGAMLASLLVIGAVLGAAERYGVLALAVAAAAGSLLPAGVMAVALARAHPESFRAGWRHPLLHACARRLPWILAIEACGLLRPLIDRGIAARALGEGAISALAYARILFEVPHQVIGLAVAAILFPELATLAARDQGRAFQRTVAHGIRAGIALTFPFAVLFVVLREPTVAVMYQRGAFDASDSAMTAHALWGYAVGLPFLAAAGVAMQAAYAARRYHLMLGVRLAALVVKVAASLLLVEPLGQAGLALGTTLFFVTLAGALGRGMAGAWSGMLPRPRILVLAGGVGGAAAWSLHGYLAGFGELSPVAPVAAWAVGLGVYAGAARALGLEEARWIEDRVRERWRGRS